MQEHLMNLTDSGQGELLSEAEKSWLAGNEEPELASAYESQCTFFTLEQMKRLINDYVPESSKETWQEHFVQFSAEFIRYYYFLEKWQCAVKYSSLEMELVPRFTLVHNRYVDAYMVFHDFVKTQHVKKAAGQFIADWFSQLVKEIKGMEKTVRKK